MATGSSLTQNYSRSQIPHGTHQDDRRVHLKLGNRGNSCDNESILFLKSGRSVGSGENPLVEYSIAEKSSWKNLLGSLRNQLGKSSRGERPREDFPSSRCEHYECSHVH
ncbi:hypothetical protein TNCV_3115371 [Trichonephila clavipes]|nr:hypothetical protein TNCV_3115371 [Trichonephila clavipes]